MRLAAGRLRAVIERSDRRSSRRPILLAMPLPVLLLGVAQAGQDPGERIFLHGAPGGVVPCAACHGLRAEGQSDTGAPRLAGQNAAHLLAELDAIAGASGGNAVMRRDAVGLDPAQRAAVAGYLSNLAAP